MIYVVTHAPGEYELGVAVAEHVSEAAHDAKDEEPEVEIVEHAECPPGKVYVTPSEIEDVAVFEEAKPYGYEPWQGNGLPE